MYSTNCVVCVELESSNVVYWRAEGQQKKGIVFFPSWVYKQSEVFGSASLCSIRFLGQYDT